MHIGVVSIFPGMIECIAAYGVVGRAIESGRVKLTVSDPRRYAKDVHRTVDDRPYGGGPGMVMKFQPLADAIRELRVGLPAGTKVMSLSPQGKVFGQADAERLAELPGFALVAGRYEGIDERLFDSEIDEELSLGDFVLSGGELAAMAVIDAVTRLLPGVLGDADSAKQDSFADGLLDHPHYTRPETVEGRRVPPVLLSGDHAEIARWRHKQALGRSFERRPDLLEKLELSVEQCELLDEYLLEHGLTRRDPASGV